MQRRSSRRYARRFCPDRCPAGTAQAPAWDREFYLLRRYQLKSGPS